MRKRVISIGLALVMATGITTIAFSKEQMKSSSNLQGKEASVKDEKMDNFKNVRIAGKDRFETANKIADEFCKTNRELEIKGGIYSDTKINKIDTVILVNEFNQYDALCATPLSRAYNAPILLTHDDNLPQSTKNQIKKMNIRKVIIVGGDGVVKSNIEKQLNKDCKINKENIERYGGKNKYETSFIVAQNIEKKLSEDTGSKLRSMFLFDGDQWQQAMIAAPIAAQNYVPILLVPKTIEPIKDLKIKEWCSDVGLNEINCRYYGNRSLGEMSDNILKALIPMKTQCDNFEIDGGNWNSTYVNQIGILDDLWENEYLDLSDKLVLANGNNFEDSLVVGPLVAKLQSYIILCEPYVHGTIEEEYEYELKKNMEQGNVLEEDIKDINKIINLTTKDLCKNVKKTYYVGNEMNLPYDAKHMIED